MLRAKKEDGASDSGQFIEGSINQRGTRITAEWLNSIQEEIANVIESRFGKNSLDASQNNQLIHAIQDTIENGEKPIEFELENNTTKKIPLQFDSKKVRFVRFFSFSERRYNNEEPAILYLEHAAIFSLTKKIWILETFPGSASYWGPRYFENSKNLPHRLTIDPDSGQLVCTTSDIQALSTNQLHIGKIYIGKIKQLKS